LYFLPLPPAGWYRHGLVLPGPTGELWLLQWRHRSNHTAALESHRLPPPGIPAWLLAQIADLSLKITYFYCSSGWEEEKTKSGTEAGQAKVVFIEGDRQVT